MYSYFYENGKESIGNIEVLKYKICLPEFEGKKRMTGFYREIASGVKKFCEGELKKYALSQYEENGEKTGRLGYPQIIYTLNGRVTHCDGEHLFVLIEAMLKRRGERAQICRRYDSHGWTLSDELLMRPKDIAALFFGRENIPKDIRKAKNLFVSENRLFCCDEERICEIELPVDNRNG